MKQIYFLFVLWACVSCTKEEKVTSEEIKTYQELESYDVVMRYSDSAKLHLIIETDKQVRLKSQDELFEKGMFVSFYNGEDTIQSTMRCDSSYYHKDTKIWNAWGNVVVHNIKEKRTLKTEYLEWMPEEHRVFTDQHVVIRSPEQEIQGEGLNAADDFSEYEIINITGIIALDE